MNGVVSHTDNRHTAFSIARLVTMLGYLYATGLSGDLDHPMELLVTQSAALALMGVLGIASFQYASTGGRLLKEGVPEADVRRLRMLLVPEPLTATLTLPIALLGIDSWSLAWLGDPLVALAISRITGPIVAWAVQRRRPSLSSRATTRGRPRVGGPVALRATRS